MSVSAGEFLWLAVVACFPATLIADGPGFTRIAADPENEKRFVALYDTASRSGIALQESLDRGRSWRTMDSFTSESAVACFTLTQDGRRLAVMAGFRRRLGSQTNWVNLPGPEPPSPARERIVSGVYCSATDPGVVLAIVGFRKLSAKGGFGPENYDYSLYQSTDAGDTWQWIVEGERFRQHCPEVPGFAASFGLIEELQSLFRGLRIGFVVGCRGVQTVAYSADRGKMWSIGRLPPGAGLVRPLPFDPARLLVITKTKTRLLSIDGGANWIPFTEQVLALHGQPLAGQILLGRSITADQWGTVAPQDFFVSRDIGRTWHSLYSGTGGLWDLDAIRMELFVLQGNAGVAAIDLRQGVSH